MQASETPTCGPPDLGVLPHPSCGMPAMLGVLWDARGPVGRVPSTT
jgi:hypothetical protein